jgi:hypothetical protein
MKEYKKRYPVECLVAHAQKRDPITFYGWESIDPAKPFEREWKKIDWI